MPAPDPATPAPSSTAPSDTPSDAPADARPDTSPGTPTRAGWRRVAPLAAWWVVVLGGVAALVVALLDVVPADERLLSGIGSVAVTSAYTWALVARAGGRPLLFGALALLLGVGVLVLDEDWLRTGAAVMTCAVASVLGVMVTVPAQRFVQAARECALAVLVAAGGALAMLGFEPVIAQVRFEYTVFGLSLLAAFALVHRLGAGLHGLGRRGLVGVLGGGILLALTLAYAELLRRYGPGDAVDSVLDGVRWTRETLGAFPRPIETVLGVPALAWGCHMRARRRQGWWICAFGVAATAPVTTALMNPATSLLEAGLSVGYGLVVGLVIGFVVIRVDLALTGPRGSRARRAEAEAAVRPEPPRASALQ